MKTHAAGENKNIVTGADEHALVIRSGRVIGRLGPRTCLQGGSDLVVLTGTKDELDIAVERLELDVSSVAPPEPLESQVQRALAQRDQIDAFLARPEVAVVAQRISLTPGVVVEGKQ